MIEVVPAVHPDGRGPHSRVHADAVGFVLNGVGGTVYFAGDTDLFDAMADLGDVDVALLPIGGWGPTLGEGHLDPDARRAGRRPGRPALVVPIHWGTYSPMRLRSGPPLWLGRPAVDFTEQMHRHGHAGRLRLLDPGQQLVSRWLTTTAIWCVRPTSGRRPSPRAVGAARVVVVFDRGRRCGCWPRSCRGFSIDRPRDALLAGFVVGMLNAVVWPALAFLVVPLSVLTLGLGAIVLDALVRRPGARRAARRHRRRLLDRARRSSSAWR